MVLMDQSAVLKWIWKIKMDYATAILALSKTVHIANRVSFNEKLSIIAKSGPNSLQCVFDFDATISKAFHNGQRVSFFLFKKTGFEKFFFWIFFNLFFIRFFFVKLNQKFSGSIVSRVFGADFTRRDEIVFRWAEQKVYDDWVWSEINTGRENSTYGDMVVDCSCKNDWSKGQE